jgi:hypothetical protein
MTGLLTVKAEPTLTDSLKTNLSTELSLPGLLKAQALDMRAAILWRLRAAPLPVQI